MPDFSVSEGRRLVDLVYTGQTTAPAAAAGEGGGPLLLLGALQAALGMDAVEVEEVEAAAEPEVARRSDRARTPSKLSLSGSYPSFL